MRRKSERRALLRGSDPAQSSEAKNEEWLPESCEKIGDTCENDLACKDGPRKTHMCVCTSTGEPPNPATGECIRNVVLGVASPILFEHIVPIGTPISTLKTPLQKSGDSTMLLTLSATMVVSLVVLGVICWWKRQKLAGCTTNRKERKNVDGPLPLSLSRSLLRNYVTNPQYIAESPFDLMPVPILARDRVQCLKDIGEGCFGKVYKGKLLMEGDGAETVAVKMLKDSANKQAVEDFMREVEIMSTFRHENILSLIGIVPKDVEGTPWMIFEYMPYGDLADVLRRNSKELWKPLPGLPPLTKESMLRIALQIAGGMKYLAEQRFVHNDLACRNCLVGEELTVKIADFGMSRDVYTCDYYKIGNSKPVPLRWMSPESVMYRRFTLESDVWSFGVVLWEIYSMGKQPYYGLNNDEVIKLIMQNILLMPPQDCPPQICDLMRACWKPEPKDRIRVPEIWTKLNKLSESISETSGASLPRPPELPVSHINVDMEAFEDRQMLDGENYLAPTATEMVEYLQPLPD